MAANGDRDAGQDKGGDRDSIWSVARGALAYYFALFATLVLAGVALLIWKADLPEGDLATRALYVWQESGSIVVPSAAYAIIILETARWTMVTAGLFEAKLKRKREQERAEVRAEARSEGLKEGLEEGLREGLREGLKEADAKWRAWYERMLEARAKGEPFDEPPPTVEEANGKEPRS